MLLKSYGFKWYWKNPHTGTGGTDRVDPEMIDTIDCDEGEEYITVRYTEDSALNSTTAKVIKIEFPPPSLLDNRWIMVYVEDIDHDKNPAFLSPYDDDPTEEADYEQGRSHQKVAGSYGSWSS